MKNKLFINKLSLITLQHFNEPTTAPTEPTNPTNQDPTTEPTQGPTGLTQEEVNEIVQRRLAKEQAKWQKKLEEDTKEAQRLATLDAEQRKQEEYNKKLRELEERENHLRMLEVKSETIGVLKEHGLSESFVDFVIGEDNEATLERINTLEKAFKAAVSAEVDKRIPSSKPNLGNHIISGEMTKEEFKALPLAKQNELYRADPEKYKQYF